MASPSHRRRVSSHATSNHRHRHLMLIDSHCHLDYFTAAELPDVLARAIAAGVAEVVTIGTTLAQSQTLPALTEAHANVWCTIGVHPHHAAEAPVPTPETLADLTNHPKVIGIGESGLDYFYDRSPRDVQQQNFRADIARILQEERDNGGKFDFLLHCFSSTRALAETAIAMGGYVSFSGILTFPRSNELREIARDLPAERLLVETDAPYLAPVPFRGKRNEPAHVQHTAKILAGLRNLTSDALAALTTANFRHLFRKTTPNA